MMRARTVSGRAVDTRCLVKLAGNAIYHTLKDQSDYRQGEYGVGEEQPVQRVQ